MLWGAASISGFVITAILAIVAIGQFAKRAAQDSARRRYASGRISVGLLCVVIAGACYLARGVVDAEIPTNTLPFINVSANSF
jgi:hypothetical protein